MGPPTGQTDGSLPMIGLMGQDGSGTSGNQYLSISGGYLVIDARGDGVDVNGIINMTGGTVIVNGPTDSGNGALDHSGFIMTGGILVAAGSSGMAQAPGTSSTQYSVMVNLTSSQPAATMFHIKSSGGEEILTFVPAKLFQSVVFSSPALKNGESYNVYTGGSSTGTTTDGLYSNGTYTPGAETSSFTISGMVTTVGTSAMGGPGGGGNMASPGGASGNMTRPGGFSAMPRPGGFSDNMTQTGRIRR